MVVYATFYTKINGFRRWGKKFLKWFADRVSLNKNDEKDYCRSRFTGFLQL